MPYRAPGPDDPRQAWILREIQKSQNTLDQAIAEAQRLPASDVTKTARLERYRALKREVDSSFYGLEKFTRTWAERDIPSLYQSGWAIGATQTGYGFDFTLPHREALDIISRDAYDDVATRLQGVRQGFTDTVDLQELYEGLSAEEILAIQKSSRSAVAQSLLTGNADPKKVARQLGKDLWEDNPNLKIIDAGGKQWQMQTYTRMLVRTKSANAYNSGSLNKYAEEKVKRVQVFDGVEDDNECASANGETWSLRYAMNHVIAHPNCRRAFAPKAGAGPVQKDTAQKNIAVAFDRFELGATAFAGFRHLRNTGEVNVSSTLARLFIEVVEAQTVPLPLVDQFLMGLLSNGLQEFDHYVESFIDPVLYHVGLLDHIPERALLIKASRPQTVIDDVSEMVRLAAIDVYGTDTNPKMQRVLSSLSEASLQLDRGLDIVKAPVLTPHKGGLKYIQWIADTVIEPSEAGRLASDTIIRLRDGTNGDIISAYKAAKHTLDEFRGIRTLHLRTMNVTWDEARKTYYELEDLINHSAALLAGDDVVYPAARAAREAQDVRPQSAINARRAYDADPELASEGLARRITEASLQDSNWERTHSRGAGDGLGSQLAVDPLVRHELTPEWADEIKAIDGTVFPVYEMPQTDEAGQLFHDLIDDARKSHKFGSSVTVYDADEYANGTYKLFLTGDGKAGFAVTDDGQLVSVFNLDDTLQRPLHTMVPLSINRGVTRADAFDTVLPEFYAKFGLQPVSRIKFVDEYAPDGWDYKLYDRFNGGRPDVVFLKLDTERIGVAYDPNAGYFVDDYDVGLASTLPTQGDAAEVPDWFIDALKKYGVSLNDQRNLNRGQRQLVTLITEATDVQSQLLVKMNAMQDVVEAQPGRALLFPASDAEHVPTSINRLWNDQNFETFTDELADKVANAGVASPRVNLDALGDFKAIILQAPHTLRDEMIAATRSFEPGDLIIQFMRNEMGYNVADKGASGSGIISKIPFGDKIPFLPKPAAKDVTVFDWKDKEAVHEMMLNFLRRVNVPTDGDLRKLSIRGDVSGNIPVDNDDMVYVLGNIMYFLKDDFWKDNADLVQKVIDFSYRKDAIVRHLPYAARMDLVDSSGHVTKDGAQKIAGLWNRQIGNLQHVVPELTEPPVSYVTLGTQLERMFGTGNVSQLTAGIHGAVYLIDDVDTGKFVVKPLQATGHTGGHSGASASMILNDWMSDILGSDVVPYRVVAMNDDDLFVISPYIDNMHESAGVATEIKDMDADALRRLNIFHYLTMEADTNTRNFMISADTKTVLRIDHESSFGFLSGAPLPETQPFGMNNRGEYFVRTKAQNAWLEGKDEVFNTDGPVRLYEATDEEVAFMMTLSRDEYDNLSVSDRRKVGDQLAGRQPLVMLDGTGETFHVPTGRVGNYEYSTFAGEANMWVSSHAVTDVELEFLERVIRNPDDVKDEMIDALDRGLEYVPDSIIDSVEITDLVDNAMINLEYRANKLVSSGIIDLSVGETTMVNQYGSSFSYGETVKIKRLGKPPPGQPPEINGLIINTWEELDGRRRASIMHNMGVGKTADELELDPLKHIVIDIEKYVDEDTLPIANVKDSVRRSRVFGGDLPPPHGVEEVADFPLDTAWVRTDDLGLAIGLEKGHVSVQFADDLGSNLVKVVDETGASVQVKMDGLYGMVGKDILESELSKLHPQHRPKKVILHTSVIEMADGKQTYGFFDDATQTAHISMAALQNDAPAEPIVGALTGVKRTLSDGLRMKTGTVLSDGAGDTRLLTEAFQDLNLESFRGVIRHEFGHGVHVRIEDTRQIRFRTKIVEDILDQFPEAATLRDLNEQAIDLLPQGFELRAGENAMQGLINYRLSVLEDIVNTNLAHHAERMLDKATADGGLLPSWAHRAYLGIQRRDPDAHHELFAEIWSKVAEAGSDDAAVASVAKQLGVSKDELLGFLDPKDIVLPRQWNLTDEGFARWMGGVLDPQAKKIIPLRGTRSRRLWEQGGFDRDVVAKVFNSSKPDPVTYNIVTGKFDTTGTAVAIKENEEIISAATDEDLQALMVDAMSAYEQKHKAILQSQEYRVGMSKAVNDETGEVEIFLDTVRVYDDELDAAQFGFSEQQLSMRNLDNGEDVELLSKYADFDEFLEAEYVGRVPYDELLGRTERVAGLQRTGKVKGVTVQSDIRTVVGGKAAPVTMREIWADKDVARIRKIAETRYNIKITDKLARENVRKVIDEGLRRYSPAQLKKRYDFYVPWHDGFAELGKKWNVSSSKVMAAAAVISPQRDATNNYAVAYLLADIIYKNDKFTRDEIAAIKKFLKEKEIQYIGFDKPDRAAMFAAAAAQLKSNSRPSDFDSDVLGYVLNEKIKDALPTFRTYTGNVGDGMPRNYKSGERFKLGVINGQNYVDTGMRAIQILRGEVSVDEAMNGAKVRPFVNNIIDPLDHYGNRDITIDYHMVNLMIWATGADSASVDSYGKIAGIDIGTKGILADVLRDMMDEGLREELEIVSDAQLQEILWGLWRDGQTDGWWDGVRRVEIKR